MIPEVFVKNFAATKTAGKLLIIAALLLGLGCAGVQDLINIQTPNVSVADVRFLGISFEGIDLAFDVNVDNPNSLAHRS